MAHPRTFNPSKEPGRCRWCGRKVSPYTLLDGSLHYYYGPHFCTLDCSSRFGRKLASMGYILEKVAAQEPPKGPA